MVADRAFHEDGSALGVGTGRWRPLPRPWPARVAAGDGPPGPTLAGLRPVTNLSAAPGEVRDDAFSHLMRGSGNAARPSFGTGSFAHHPTPSVTPAASCGAAAMGTATAAGLGAGSRRGYDTVD